MIMKMLAISTATKQLSLGIWSGKRVLVDYNLHLGHRHNERLIPGLRDILAESGLKLGDLEGIAVDVGPGSFTGLRISLATVKSFALVNSLKIAAVSSLELAAAPYLGADCCLLPVLDAGQGRVYTALFQGGGSSLLPEVRLAEDQALALEELPKMLTESEADLSPSSRLLVMGPAAGSYYQELEEGIKSQLESAHNGYRVDLLADYQSQGRGGRLAELGEKYCRKGFVTLPGELEPKYLKKPQAVINRERKRRSQKNNGAAEG